MSNSKFLNSKFFREDLIPNTIHHTIKLSKTSQKATSCTFSKNGTLCAVGTLGGDIFVYDSSVFTEIRKLIGGHSKYIFKGKEYCPNITTIKFYSNENFLLSGASDGRVCFWDIRKSKLIKSIRFASPVKSISVHPTRPIVLVSFLLEHPVLIYNLGVKEEKRRRIVLKKLIVSKLTSVVDPVFKTKDAMDIDDENSSDDKNKDKIFEKLNSVIQKDRDFYSAKFDPSGNHIFVGWNKGIIYHFHFNSKYQWINEENNKEIQNSIQRYHQKYNKPKQDPFILAGSTILRIDINKFNLLENRRKQKNDTKNFKFDENLGFIPPRQPEKINFAIPNKPTKPKFPKLPPKMASKLKANSNMNTNTQEQKIESIKSKFKPRVKNDSIYINEQEVLNKEIDQFNELKEEIKSLRDEEYEEEKEVIDYDSKINHIKLERIQNLQEIKFHKKFNIKKKEIKDKLLLDIMSLKELSSKLGENPNFLKFENLGLKNYRKPLAQYIKDYLEFTSSRNLYENQVHVKKGKLNNQRLFFDGIESTLFQQKEEISKRFFGFVQNFIDDKEEIIQDEEYSDSEDEEEIDDDFQIPIPGSYAEKSEPLEIEKTEDIKLKDKWDHKKEEEKDFYTDFLENKRRIDSSKEMEILEKRKIKKYIDQCFEQTKSNGAEMYQEIINLGDSTKYVPRKPRKPKKEKKKKKVVDIDEESNMEDELKEEVTTEDEDEEMDIIDGNAMIQRSVVESNRERRHSLERIKEDINLTPTFKKILTEKVEGGIGKRKIGGRLAFAAFEDDLFLRSEKKKKKKKLKRKVIRDDDPKLIEETKEDGKTPKGINEQQKEDSKKEETKGQPPKHIPASKPIYTPPTPVATKVDNDVKMGEVSKNTAFDSNKKKRSIDLMDVVIDDDKDTMKLEIQEFDESGEFEGTSKVRYFFREKKLDDDILNSGAFSPFDVSLEHHGMNQKDQLFIGDQHGGIIGLNPNKKYQNDEDLPKDYEIDAKSNIGYSENEKKKIIFMPIKDFEFSKNGKYVLVNAGEEVQLYDTLTGTQLQVFDLKKKIDEKPLTIENNCFGFSGIYLNPHNNGVDSEYIYMSSKSNNEAFVFDQSSNKKLGDFELNPKSVITSITWSPTAPVMVMGTNDNQIHVWDHLLVGGWGGFPPSFTVINKNSNFQNTDSEYDSKHNAIKYRKQFLNFKGSQMVLSAADWMDFFSEGINSLRNQSLINEQKQFFEDPILFIEVNIKRKTKKEVEKEIQEQRDNMKEFQLHKISRDRKRLELKSRLSKMASTSKKVIVEEDVNF